MDPFQVCCLGEKWRLSAGKSRGRARQKDKEAMEELQERLLSAKNCSEEATELRALLRTYLVTQLKVLAINLGVKLTGGSKKKMILSSGSWVCVVLVLFGRQQARSTMTQLKRSTSLIARMS